MPVKAFLFSVWAPEGDDCPPAVAAVVASSLAEARTALRRANVRLVAKEPRSVIREQVAVAGLPAEGIVWRYDDDDEWRTL